MLRIRDVYPGSWILSVPDLGSRILDLGSSNNKKGGGKKKSFYLTFFCSQKFHKIGNYLIFEQVQIKMSANWQSIILTFTQRLSLSSQKFEFGPKSMPDPNLPQCWRRVTILSFFTSVNVNVKVEEMNVCDNLGDHLVGNVFVKFKREEDAEKAVADLNNRWQVIIE